MTAHSHVRNLRCVGCGRDFDLGEVETTCPACGALSGTLDIEYDLDALRAARFGPEVLRGRTDPTIRRYHEILPIRDPEAEVPIPIGMTPLYPLLEAADRKLPARVWIKDDTRHPSGSSKDRATAIGLARAREIGATVVAAASTGNAASSLATLAARAGLRALIFAPASAPPAKLVQIRIHGALLFAIQGTYDEAFDLCMEACASQGYTNRNTAVNPFLGEGKKTIALEIWEQLGYRAPGAVVVPVGDGCILGGIAKGFSDLHDLGLIQSRPRLIGVQAEGSAALAAAWRGGLERCEPIEARTLADSISVSLPRDQVKALRGVRASNGAFVTVTDEEILAAASRLASRAGIFAEPAAAASFAGLVRGTAEGVIAPDEETVLVITGHGLKDIDAAARAAGGNESISIPPDLIVFTRALAAREA